MMFLNISSILLVGFSLKWLINERDKRGVTLTPPPFSPKHSNLERESLLDRESEKKERKKEKVIEIKD